MLRINARKTLEITPDELWSMFDHDNDGLIELVYDDGVVNTRSTLLKHARPAWGVHKAFPNLPLLKRHGLDNYIDRVLPNTVNISQLSTIYKDIWDILQPDENNPDVAYGVIDTFSMAAMRACSKLYNLVVRHYKKYSVSFDIQDYLQISNDPRLLKAKKEAKPTAEDIAKIYRVLDEIFKDPALRGNPICMSVNNGACRAAQAYQLFGCRGFATDVSLEAFKVPIMRSYFDGFRLLPDMLMGSRDSVIAAANTDIPLQTVEYYNRSSQMGATHLKNLHWGDCGTSKYLNWLVKKEHLKILEGKRYITDDGTLKSFKGDEDHLVGSYVKLRSIYGQCAHPDPMGVCTTCFGDMSRSFSRGINLGHSAVINMLSPLSQKVMSTKHLIMSVMLALIVMDEFHRRFLTVDSDRYGYGLNHEVLTRYSQVYLVLTPEQAPGLPDIPGIDTEELELWDAWRISTFAPARRDDVKKKKKKPSHAILQLIDNHGEIEEVSINFTLNETKACLSKDFMKYVAKYGFTTDMNGNFVVNMGSWNPSDLMVQLPMQHADVLAFQQRIEDFHKKVSMTEFDYTPEAQLEMFIDILLAGASPNFALIEAMMLTMAVGDDGTGFIPKANRGNGGVKKITMREGYNRGSLAPALSYERQTGMLMSPQEHLREIRANSSMDQLYVPGQMGLNG